MVVVAEVAAAPFQGRGGRILRGAPNLACVPTDLCLSSMMWVGPSDLCLLSVLAGAILDGDDDDGGLCAMESEAAVTEEELAMGWEAMLDMALMGSDVLLGPPLDDDDSLVVDGCG